MTSTFRFDNAPDVTTTATKLITSNYNGVGSADHMTSVTIANTVTELGKNLFNGCIILTSVGDISTTVIKIIDNQAFINCGALTAISFPTTLTNLGVRSFSGCASLLDITIPATVNTINDSAFSGCTSLTALTFSPGTAVTLIPADFIRQSTSLASIDIPEGITSIGTLAFYKCTDLTSAIVPASVTSLGTAVFRDCTALTSLTYTDSQSVTTVGLNTLLTTPAMTITYYNADPLNSTGISAALLTQQGQATGGSTFLYPFTPPIHTIFNFSVIPLSTTVVGTALTTSSFESRTTELQSVSIGSSVVSLAASMFANCTALTEVEVYGTSITALPASCFESCTAIIALVLPASVTIINDSAFSGCTSLATLVLPSAVKAINNSAFSGCTDLILAEGIPTAVTTLGPNAFDGCSTIATAIDLSLNAQITVIPDYCFRNCTLLDITGVSSTLTSIGMYAFNASAIAGMVIPPTVSTIGEGAFNACTSLLSIEFDAPSGDLVTVINEDTFNGCTGLTEIINIPNTVTHIGDDAFYNCGSLIFRTTALGVQAGLPTGLETIGDNAYRLCAAFTISDPVPLSLTTIGNYAFRNTGITQFLFPTESPITSIPTECFNTCTALTSFTFPKFVSTIGANILTNDSALTDIIYDNAMRPTSIGANPLTGTTLLDTITYNNVFTEEGVAASISGLSLALQADQASAVTHGGITFVYNSPRLTGTIALADMQQGFTFYNNTTFPTLTTVGFNKNVTSFSTATGNGLNDEAFLQHLAKKIFGSLHAVDFLSNSGTILTQWGSARDAAIDALNAVTASGTASKGVVDALITNAANRFTMEYNATVSGATASTYAGVTATGGTSGATALVTTVIADATTITSITID